MVNVQSAKRIECDIETFCLLRSWYDELSSKLRASNGSVDVQ